MDKPIWLDDAVRMVFDERIGYPEIVKRLRSHFPKDMHESSIKEIIRGRVRSTDRYKVAHEVPADQQPCKTTYRETGEVVFDEIIELLIGGPLTSKRLYAATTKTAFATDAFLAFKVSCNGVSNVAICLNGYQYYVGKLNKVVREKYSSKDWNYIGIFPGI